MACGCGNDKERTILITACSGAANTGFLADQVARGLRADKVGAMTCLAALGAELSGYVESARNADLNVVIDGCPVGCGAKTFSKLGIPCEQLVMTDFGAEKGKTVITPEVVADVTRKVAERISGGTKA
jgi:uncharacterized metal-binding protein